MLPAGRILSDEVQQGLEAGLGHRVEIFVEFLDALRFPEPIFSDKVAELIEAKYRGQRFERSEEHTSELQSLMRISYAVFCLKKKKTIHNKELLGEQAE